jgi:MarR family transcriptional regulator, transcriptional regulator for hemolysin
MNHRIPPHLHASVGYRIAHAQRVLRVGFLSLMRVNGLGELTPEQWWMMAQLADVGECAQSDLGNELFGDRPNVTRMLERMEAGGLVARATDPADARRRLVRLTPAGRDLHDRALRVVEAERARLGAALDPVDVAATLRVLAALEGLQR